MPTTPPSIGALPAAPDPANRATFNTLAYPWSAALGPWTTQVSAVAANVKANADEAEADAIAAAASVTAAAAQVTLAAAQATIATGAVATSGAVLWVSGTTYAIGNVVYSPINLANYRRKTAGAGTTDPSLDFTNWASLSGSGISQVTTATTATTLTSTPTLLQITPASYGVTVTLPNATTCSLGGPLHCIDNQGAFPVRVVNNSGTLLGFVFAGVVSYISLDNNSTAAGLWAVSSNEVVGASAQLLTANMRSVYGCISIDANREFLLGHGPSFFTYGVVYDKSTNTFGTPTLIRSANCTSGNLNGGNIVLSAANQILHVSCPDAGTAFEAVTLSISGTTITVNTAATATLSGNINIFAEGCGLIAVGSSFVTSYRMVSAVCQIRALTVSGTTVTIGAATALTGTVAVLSAASTDKVVTVSTNGGNIQFEIFTVSGTTITVGTGASTTATSPVLSKLFALGSRLFCVYSEAGSTYGTLMSISGTVLTVSYGTASTAGTFLDAIVVGSNKVLMLNAATTNNANIITDSSGTASAGTAITLSSQTVRTCVYASGTDVIVSDGTATQSILTVSCSGASPVLSSTQAISTTQYNTAFSASNAVLSRSPNGLYGTAFAQEVSPSLNPTTSSQSLVVRGGVASTRVSQLPKLNGTNYRGKAANEIWITDAASVIQKRECVA